MKVWSFLYSVAKFHANPSLFSDGNSPEKKKGSVLASYMNGLTVLLITKNLQTAIRPHSDSRARIRSYSLGVMAESSTNHQLAWRVCCLLYKADAGTLLEVHANKTLCFSKNCALMDGLSMYNFFGITQLMNSFRIWLFDH